MQMCWVEPTQRPSLRELRIMLLHLRSSKDAVDTTAFDVKWNQLKPRPSDLDPFGLTGGGGGVRAISYLTSLLLL